MGCAILMLLEQVESLHAKLRERPQRAGRFRVVDPVGKLSWLRRYGVPAYDPRKRSRSLRIDLRGL